MAYEGMDPDEIESLGRQLSTQSSNLGTIMTKLDGLVDTMKSNWDGADSGRFHDAYFNTYRKQITDAATNLSTLSNTAIQQASEQRQTSA